MITDNIDRGKIFIWGNFGKELKDLDKDRCLGIAQNNAEYYLTKISLDNIFEVLQILKDKEALTDNEINKIYEIINDDNKKHKLFSELNKFLTKSNDMLSIGSFLTGELDNSSKMAKILGD